MTHKEKLLHELHKLHDGMLHAEATHQALIEKVKEDYRNSAINLVDYLSLRATDIETLQLQLHRSGLSSLSSSEGHIKSQLIHVMEWLGAKPGEKCEVNPENGLKYLQRNIEVLLGVKSTENVIPVMVTFDTNFADDLDLLCALLENGMRLARINCAHDNPDTWTAMISNLEQAKKKTGLPCKLYMDLAGPKIRTHIVDHKNQPIKLKVEEGDKIWLADPEADHKKSKNLILCTQTGIVENLEPGQRVFFDDGLFEAVVLQVDEKIARLRIARIATKKPVIKNDKGINFPETSYKIASITEYDKQCLPFIAKHADMVGYSFVNSAADMAELQAELTLLNKPGFAIIAKIETRKAVDELPGIILQGLSFGPTGVMVARGDMAIEIGFERMSEIQEEILWICEAAHTPVIWATQVLENMQTEGIATRSEITDATHAAQADCVMINKGDYTIDVLEILKDILNRSRKNKFKNSRLFRSLSIAQHFIKGN